MAIGLQACKVKVAGLPQIHVAALNHLLQMVFCNAEVLRQRHQSLHHRVLRLSGKAARDFKPPPLQLLGGDTGILYFIDHIVDFAAERIKSSDGRAFARR